LWDDGKAVATAGCWAVWMVVWWAGTSAGSRDGTMAVERGVYWVGWRARDSAGS
jgi:hypothetical protein